MTWERGRKDIERLIADGELERVTPSDEVATRLLADANAHIALASKGIEDDPAGALQLSYDAARKASAALLAVQGLRATTRGGHIAVIDAVKAQFNDRGGMEIFGRLHPLRRRRNRTRVPRPRVAGRQRGRRQASTCDRPECRRRCKAAHRQRAAGSVGVSG
jgi:hypothetical protein